MKVCFVGRLSDGFILCETDLEDLSPNFRKYKKQGMALLKKLKNAPIRSSVEAGNCTFQYFFF